MSVDGENNIDNFILNEANRCFNCVNKPCMRSCPLNNDIPQIISLVKVEKYEEAYEVLTKTTVFPSIASLVCPHEKQCKSNCTAKFKGEAIDIGCVENFLGRLAIEKGWFFSNLSNNLTGLKFAVIGGGPAGLTASAFLARNGAEVTIFEKQEKLGGILRYGIPEFRLDKSLLDEAIKKILEIDIQVNFGDMFGLAYKRAITVECGRKLGENLFLDDLKEKFDAIFLAFGSNRSKPMSIMGEELNGVFGGNELLECGNHPEYTGKEVFVSGGGNVAIDVARTIKRLGAKSVKVVYRRSESEMPAEVKEIEDAKIDGVEFLFHTNLLAIYGNDKVEEIECMKTFYDGEMVRENLKNIEDSNFRIKADYVVMAIGSEVDIDLVNKLNLETDSKNHINIDENYSTSDDKVFAIGDVAGVKSTVAWAASSGRKAVQKFIELRSE